MVAGHEPRFGINPVARGNTGPAWKLAIGAREAQLRAGFKFGLRCKKSNQETGFDFGPNEQAQPIGLAVLVTGRG